LKVSRSARAGLQFPVGRIHRRLRKETDKRIKKEAPVFAAAALEYLTAEMLELAGNAARDNNKKIIKPRHLQLAIRNDAELDKLLKDVIIADGGVLPMIQAVLLPKDSNVVEAEPSKSKPKPNANVVPPKTNAGPKATVANNASDSDQEEDSDAGTPPPPPPPRPTVNINAQVQVQLLESDEDDGSEESESDEYEDESESEQDESNGNESDDTPRSSQAY